MSDFVRGLQGVSSISKKANKTEVLEPMRALISPPVLASQRI